MISDKINNEIQLAINLAQAGKVAESQSLLENLVKKNRKNTNVLMVLAELNGKTGDFKSAVQNYKKVIRLAPGNRQAHTSLAMLYHSRGNFQKAEQSYKQSLKLDNNQAVINFNLGLVLQEQGKLEDAQLKYLKAISLDPTYAKAYANLGYIQLQLNQIDESIASYRKALDQAPDVPEIYNSLGVGLLRKGLTDEAEQCQRKALELRPDYPEAWEGLGATYLYVDNAEMAVDGYKQALARDPERITALCGLAKSLSLQGLHDEAIDHIEQALTFHPEHIEAHLTHGNILVSLGKLDAALESCNHILKQSPKNTGALLLAATIYEKKAQPEKSFSYLEPLLLEPYSNIEAVLCFASISKSLDRINDAILMMEDILANNPQLQSSYRRHLFFALGKAHDSLNNYEAAFDFYRTGNKLKRTDFKISSFKNMIDANINFFNEEFISKHALETSSERPVFIVGMPRSGTSLVEQIISSHPQVFGAGELNNINDITKGAALAIGSEKTYPECLVEAGEEDLTLFAKSYIDYLDDLSPEVLRVTDKMPFNFLHIGLIRTLFPKAHIIHCIRNPLDSCLSCYFQDFGTNQPWIYDLENIAHVYEEYLRMMSYWQNETEIPIHNVKYEELVENQEIISKKLISQIGLDWDSQCLQFHKNERFIWTASYDQVRQPIYKKSTARWMNYQQQLTPLINILGNS